MHYAIEKKTRASDGLHLRGSKKWRYDRKKYNLTRERKRELFRCETERGATHPTAQ